jgi:hypothetical protein
MLKLAESTPEASSTGRIVGIIAVDCIPLTNHMGRRSAGDSSERSPVACENVRGLGLLAAVLLPRDHIFLTAPSAAVRARVCSLLEAFEQLPFAANRFI